MMAKHGEAVGELPQLADPREVGGSASGQKRAHNIKRARLDGLFVCFFVLAFVSRKSFAKLGNHHLKPLQIEGSQAFK